MLIYIYIYTLHLSKMMLYSNYIDCKGLKRLTGFCIDPACGSLRASILSVCWVASCWVHPTWVTTFKTCGYTWTRLWSYPRKWDMTWPYQKSRYDGTPFCRYPSHSGPSQDQWMSNVVFLRRWCLLRGFHFEVLSQNRNHVWHIIYAYIQSIISYHIHPWPVETSTKPQNDRMIERGHLQRFHACRRVVSCVQHLQS